MKNPNRRRIAALMASLGAVTLLLTGGTAGASEHLSWKGAETMAPVALTPNLARCGPPPTVEARFAGSGIDTEGGMFAVAASGCFDLDTLRIFDLEATDTYVQSRDTIRILPDDFTLRLDERTCVATNPQPVRFRVGGGTGRFANSGGGGTFDFALNHPPCNGLAQPAHIWFRGEVTGVR